MNIHPLFVHFPIAMFTLYTALEVLRFQFLTRQPWYFFVKAVVVIFGSAMSVITIATGFMSANFQAGNPDLDYHKFFGITTACIFFIIALSYALTWYANYRMEQGISLQSGLVKFAQWVVGGKFVIILAILGFICVTITGGIGGAMVFGPDADPFFKPVYKLLLGKN